jgi:hypothetical protein
VLHGAGQEAVGLVVGVPQQFLDGRTQLRVPGAGRVQEGGPLRRRYRERLVEKPFNVPEGWLAHDGLSPTG